MFLYVDSQEIVNIGASTEQDDEHGVYNYIMVIQYQTL